MQETLKTWWADELSSIARTLATSPIVKTTAGMLPASACGNGSRADFVLPRFDLQPKDELKLPDELKLSDVWRLANKTNDLHPPIWELAADWTTLAKEWRSLGIQPRFVTLTELAETVRKEAPKLSDLRVKQPPIEWLARFLDAVGKVSKHRNCSTVLVNLLPDQNNVLKSPTALRRDEGIPIALKRVTKEIGHDVRQRLLLGNLVELSRRKAYKHLDHLITTELPHTLDEATVLEECLTELSKQLPDGELIGPEKHGHRRASIALLKFLWQSRRVKAASFAQRCPLIGSDETAVRWTPQRKTMAPISTWHADAQPFSRLYRQNRILSEDYDQNLVQALVKWDIAFDDPISLDSPRELREERLGGMLGQGENPTDVLVSDLPFSQIALLPNELIQRCQSQPELARLLLGLLLRHVAPHDPSWRATRPISGRRNGEDIQITVYPALWLSDLRTKAWVPVQGEKGFAPTIANEGNLRELIDPTWLMNNDDAVQLLSLHFDFDPLRLQLMSTAPSKPIRVQLEQKLCTIVQLIGADPSNYTSLAEELQAKQKKRESVERNQWVGKEVERLLKEALQMRDLRVERKPVGSDFIVVLEGLDGTEWFLIEVKATSDKIARMSVTQAETASAKKEKYALCVVHIDGQAVTQELVQARCRFIMDVGHRIEPIWTQYCNVTDAKAKASRQIGSVELEMDDGEARFAVNIDKCGTLLPLADFVARLHNCVNIP